MTPEFDFPVESIFSLYNELGTVRRAEVQQLKSNTQNTKNDRLLFKFFFVSLDEGGVFVDIYKLKCDHWRAYFLIYKRSK